MRIYLLRRKYLAVVFITLYPGTVLAADVVPYSIKSIQSVGSGYVELVGPGKIQINGEVMTYEGTKYVSAKNIDSMSGVSGVSIGCMLHYSSEGYTENISVTTQSCDEIISIIRSSLSK